jgi:hypothetical protein
MAGQRTALLAFNRGLVSALAAARADVKRVLLSAKTFNNWIPRVLGSMMVRPGLGHVGYTYSNKKARLVTLVASETQKAIVELTDYTATFWVNDTKVELPTVATTMTGFTVALTDWTDNDEVGASSSVAPVSLILSQYGTGTNAAIIDQSVTPVSANVEHCLHVTVLYGAVTLNVGTTAGAGDYVSDQSLTSGEHYISFTPSATFVVRLLNRSVVPAVTEAIELVHGVAGTQLAIATPWSEADLQSIQHDASADITWVACSAVRPMQIEHRGDHSWSVVDYKTRGGPFKIVNTSAIRMKTNALIGPCSLYASAPVFKAADFAVASETPYYGLVSSGTSEIKTVGALDDATGSVIVESAGPQRTLTITIGSLTATGDTIILESSYDEVTWTAVAGKSWTSDVSSTTYNDGSTNVVVYYRLRCSVYAAGAPVLVISSPSGTTFGVVRATAFVSTTEVSGQIIIPVGNQSYTADWYEGLYSATNGWPSAIALHQGRLWWAGGNPYVCGSASDAYYDFDPTAEGDSAAIVRSYGSGPVDSANFLLPLAKLILGGAISEYSIQGSALNEPVTNSTFVPREIGSHGSAAVYPAKIDKQGVFVQRCGTRILSLSLGGDYLTYDYQVDMLNKLVPEIGGTGIVSIAVQRQPDTRIHCVRADGTVAILIYDTVEDVSCWVTVSTDGLIEDAAVLPGDSGETEDHVYYVVKRTDAALNVYRSLERWAFEADCIGGTQCLLADGHFVYSGAPATVISGLPDHMDGKAVVVWADGKDVGHDASDNLIYTVASNSITLATAASDVVIGLPYDADWQSGKLMELQTNGTPLTKPKTVAGLGLVAQNLHPKGVRYGPDFTNMDPLPGVEAGRVIDPDTIRAEYEEQTFEFDGQWSPDSRICLRGMAPRPATIMALIAEVDIG